MKSFSTMLKTELKLSIRGMDMVIFATILPIVVTVIIGIIYGAKPAFEGAEYTFFEQSFGAVASIGICVSGVMGMPLVIADYRHKKILKRFRVTPVSPSMLLAVQVTINALYSIVSAVLVYLVSSVFFGYSMKGSVLLFIGTFFLIMISIFSIGVMVAGVAKNSKTANLLCCILYFPMLIFSGATLPYEVMPSIMQKAADIMPLTQGIKILKATSLGLPIYDVLFPVMVMIAFTVVCDGISVKFFKWE